MSAVAQQAVAPMVAMAALTLLCSCGSDPAAPAADRSPSLQARSGSLNGRAGTMPAFYDDHPITINFKQQPGNAEQALLAHNGSINTIYMSDAGLPGGAPFIAVIDAIQGDGFNPLWQEKQIAFTPGHTPHQLTSDTDVLAAQGSGEITLTPTGEVYRCAVVGSKP